MESEPRIRIWPYLALVFCLFALSLVAPELWRGLRCPPRAARTAPSEPQRAAAVELRQMSAAPELLQPRRVLLDPQTSPADLLHGPWEELTGPAGAAAQGEAGERAEFGALVADDFDFAESDEVLPPQSPQASAADAQPRHAPRAVDALAAQRDAGASEKQNKAATVWPRPHALIEQLQSIDGDATARRWAADVLAELDILAAVDAIDSETSQSVLRRLEQLAIAVGDFILQVRPAQRQAQILAAADALHRRVVAWRQVQIIAARPVRTQFVNTVSNDDLLLQIARAMRTIPGRRAPPAWREYLGLADLQDNIAAGPADIYERAYLARRVLDRLNSPRLDRPQQALLDKPEFKRLAAGLRTAATEPIDELAVVYALEQFEQTSSETDAQRLAATAARLRWSTDEEVAELGRRIDANYRAANVRAAFTAELLNRLLPQNSSKTEAVDDYIASSYVSGQRTVSTKMSLRLIPDAQYWRMEVQADGEMASDTASYAGSATLLTQGAGEFSAQKRFLVDRHRMHSWPAKAQASYQGQLYSVSTTYDALPIISRLARSAASDSYRQNQWEARREVEAKLKRRAAEMLDKQARQPLDEAEAGLRRGLLAPLGKTDVEAVALRLLTSRQRIVGHYRLAGEHQLGAHTPRPWAPENALLSLQIHESAINNVIAGLQLDGRQGHVQDLFREIYAVFGREDAELPASMPENVTVLFAPEDAVRVSLQEGRLEVILQLAELRTDNRVWRDLLVRNYYAPDPSSLHARLVRDSTVRLKGKRLGARDQIALRGIFTKIFGDNREFAILPAALADNERLQDLAVTQYVIRDGWLGVAIAPPHRGMATPEHPSDPAHRQARRTDVVFE